MLRCSLLEFPSKDSPQHAQIASDEQTHECECPSMIAQIERIAIEIKIPAMARANEPSFVHRYELPDLEERTEDMGELLVDSVVVRCDPDKTIGGIDDNYGKLKAMVRTNLEETYPELSAHELFRSCYDLWFNNAWIKRYHGEAIRSYRTALKTHNLTSK